MPGGVQSLFPGCTASVFWVPPRPRSCAQGQVAGQSSICWLQPAWVHCSCHQALSIGFDTAVSLQLGVSPSLSLSAVVQLSSKPLRSLSKCGMQLPVRLLVGTGCLVAAVAANRLRQGKKSSKSRSQPHPDSALDATRQLVQAYASLSPSVSGVQQIPPAAVAPSVGRTVGLFLLYTVLVCSTAAAAALRGQWDLVAAITAAWLLVLLDRVGAAGKANIEPCFKAMCCQT